MSTLTPDEVVAAHFANLDAQLAALTAQHGQPVAVNLQSGGYVAYATWLADDRARLLGYDLGGDAPTLEWDVPLTHLGVNGAPALPWVERPADVDPDRLTNSDGEEVITFWDMEDANEYGEYRDGYYWVHYAATGITHVYGVGAAL